MLLRPLYCWWLLWLVVIVVVVGRGSNVVSLDAGRMRRLDRAYYPRVICTGICNLKYKVVRGLQAPCITDTRIGRSMKI